MINLDTNTVIHVHVSYRIMVLLVDCIVMYVCFLCLVYHSYSNFYAIVCPCPIVPVILDGVTVFTQVL